MSSGKSDMPNARKVEPSEESSEDIHVVSAPSVDGHVQSGGSVSGEDSMDSVPFEPIDQERDELKLGNRKLKLKRKVNEKWINDVELGIRSLKGKVKAERMDVECVVTTRELKDIRSRV
ncbi:hypothetical protein L1987_44511 [Smallanthus sonchifolius]|uniref:Uncharacterized protein n=1 Tax=Smallanthus sonchifolius TaxID=185202 RepID=A0ACB9GPE3_9ASTR|nr:hypothetical protein L1987_44511 [Smallanthus sonchifolius]